MSLHTAAVEGEDLTGILEKLSDGAVAIGVARPVGMEQLMGLQCVRETMDPPRRRTHEIASGTTWLLQPTFAVVQGRSVTCMALHPHSHPLWQSVSNEEVVPPEHQHERSLLKHGSVEMEVMTGEMGVELVAVCGSDLEVGRIWEEERGIWTCGHHID